MIKKQEIINRIDEAIKYVWIRNIKRDYDDLALLMEASLQASFYHHLRNELGERFLVANNLRLYLEWQYRSSAGFLKKADIAIVELDREKYYSGKHLKDSAKKETAIAIIEFKYYGGKIKTAKPYFISDVAKIKEFVAKNPDTYCYLGFFHEVDGDEKDAFYFMDGRQTERWAKEKVTLLYGYNRFGEVNDSVFGIDKTTELNNTNYFKDYTWPHYEGRKLIDDL
jgi:hypothetical protein